VTIAQVTKGHGTANDFVLVHDPQCRESLDAETVRALTDRRRGVGGDGLIRVVRSAALAAGQNPEPEAQAAASAGAEWFMDYRNADGSIAEMCGNGVRVFAHYLVEKGLADPAAPLLVGTRGGVKIVTVVDDPTDARATGAAPAGAPWYRVDMGTWRMPGAGAELEERGADARVSTRGIEVGRPAVSVDMGNPHTVVALQSLDELIAADLGTAPAVDPAPPHGTNVEYIVVEADGDDDPRTGRLRMRVHERGVGETFACGTGACAAALAARFWAGAHGPVDWFVEQPGGTVRVEVDGSQVALSGPAVLVAEVVLTGR
jgi:diaminopimelate epimerase